MGLSTPMVSSTKLTKHGVDYLEDPTLQRSTVGALEYATITRLEICFAVNKVCQFMTQSLEDNWSVPLRYLNILLTTFPWASKGWPINWQTLFTANDISGQVRVAYWSAPQFI